jgi:hypothetical protein
VDCGGEWSAVIREYSLPQASAARSRAPEAVARRDSSRGLVAPKGADESGGGADGAREVPPRRQPGKRDGQVQDDAAGRSLDPDGQLDQPLAQRVTWASAHAVLVARRCNS